MSTRKTEDRSKEKAGGARTPMAGWKKGALVAIALILVLSVVARAALTGGGEPPPGSGPPGSGPADGKAGASSSFLPGGTTPPADGSAEPKPEPEGIEKALPYITEGSFFALIFFALGYASKKFMKVGLIVIAVFFVGLQVLSYSEVIAIDWPRAVDLLDRFVLNLKENQTLTEVLTDRLPSAGGALAGYLAGFRSG